ncbi:MAG: hypothetical protein R3B93_18200 [Bacteroidia bacterium]
MKSSPFLFLFVLSMGLYGQNDANFAPPDSQVVITAFQTVENIHIDGKLDEPSWQNAPVIREFFRREPRQGGKSNTKRKFAFCMMKKTFT